MIDIKYNLKIAKDNFSRWSDYDCSSEEETIVFFNDFKEKHPDAIGIIKKITTETLHTFRG